MGQSKKSSPVSSNFIVFCVQVLKTKQGIPISLAVVFIAVARRLRVKIEPVSSTKLG